MKRAPGVGFVKLAADGFEEFPLAVVQVSLDLSITGMNRAARSTLGLELDARSLLLGDGSAPEFEVALARQLSPQPSSYLLNGGKYHVTAFPTYDEDGRLSGSLCIVANRSVDRANMELMAAMSRAHDARDLLRSLEQTLHEVLAFDGFSVSLVAADQSMLRSLYEGGDAFQAPTRRWWPVPAALRATFENPDTRIFDLATWLGSAPGVADDPALQAWLAQGVRHHLLHPVWREGRVSSMLSLWRRHDQPFETLDMQRLDELRVSEVMDLALQLEQRDLQHFAVGLTRQMQGAARAADVGAVFVAELRGYFGWEHVSLLRVNLDEDTISLVSQSSASAHGLPEGYIQSAAVGVLGEVVRSGRAVAVNDSAAAAAYLGGNPATRSQLCLPMPGDPVQLLLNVESPLVGAFGSEERESLAWLIEALGLVLDRALAQDLNESILGSATEGILLTRDDGAIVRVNPAAARLLRCPADALVGSHMAALIAGRGEDEEASAVAAAIVQSEYMSSTEVRLRCGDGTAIAVLLSCATLPPHIGGKVYLAADLTYQKSAERADALGRLFRQVASESRLPLALASAYVNQLSAAALGAESSALLEKTLHQLRRADLPLERVVRMAASDRHELPLQPVSLGSVVLALARTHAIAVRVEDESGSRAVLVAQGELEFCLSSVFAFLMQSKAQHESIGARIGAEPAAVTLSFELVDDRTGAGRAASLDSRIDAHRQFELVVPVLQDLMRRMGGDLTPGQGGELGLDFRMRAET